MKNRYGLALWATALCSLLVPQLAVAQEGDPSVLARMQRDQPAAPARAGSASPSSRSSSSRSAAAGRRTGFTRRNSAGWRTIRGASPTAIDITYLVDQSDGATASGLTNAQTEAAIDRSMNTWQANSCLKKVDIVKRADTGADPDIFDSFFGFGGFGDPFLADITEAGWLPRAFFEAVGGPGGGRGILAFSVTFIFTDDAGIPTDINGDNRLDTALNEVYYNNTFGDPAATGPAIRGASTSLLPGIDVETVALHENGHSLGIGHFGPPPAAVMNPIYAGIRHSPLAVDSAGMCSVCSSWPK